MRRFNRRIAGWLQRLLALLLAGLALIATVDIVAWLGWQSSWAEAAEIQGILLVWFALLGAAWGVHERAHLSVGLLADRLPVSLRYLVHRCSAIAVGLFGLGLAYYGYRLADVVTNTLPATGWPASIQYLPAVVAGALMALFGFSDASSPLTEISVDSPSNDQQAPPSEELR